jgi:tetratricopeptide (TPR) repeat protein
MEMDYLLTPEELMVMPRWCQVKLLTVRRQHNLPGGENVPDSVLHEYAKWNGIIGKDIYVYTHHYCRGLNWINRYKKSFTTLPYKNVENDRERALQEATMQFKFMKGHLQPKHKLYYQMLMDDAYVYWEKKDYKNALKNYSELMQRKPEYAPVYIKYAEILETIGEKEEAIKVLQLGLEKTKGNLAIKQALSALGGTSAK